MQPNPLRFTVKVNKEKNGTSSSVTTDNVNSLKMEEKDAAASSGLRPMENAFQNLESTLKNPANLTVSEGEEEHGSTSDEENQSKEKAQNQLVLYDPANNGAGETEPAPDFIGSQPRPLRRYSFPSQTSRVLPSVGAFTVQCAKCFKWRLIPTKEKYEEIREHILEQPFSCENAREWRPDVSCDDPADILQDGSRLWAIDKPNIAQAPPGWQRLLRIRGEGSTKFADVYYVAPSGKRLRSMVEIQRYLDEHPEHVEQGVRMSQFSFQTPRPLQENYVRKRPRSTPVHGGPSEPAEVSPIAWAGPDEDTELQLGGPGLSTPYFKDPVFGPSPKKRRTPANQMLNGD